MHVRRSALLLLVPLMLPACRQEATAPAPRPAQKTAAAPAIAPAPADRAPAVQPLEVPSAAGAAEPFVSAAADGSLLMSWIETMDGTPAVRMARYAAGKWSAPSTIVRRPDLFVNWADFPSVVESGDRTLFAHWLQKSGGDGHSYDIWMASSRDGGATWTSPMLLNTDGVEAEHGFVTLVPDTAKGSVDVAWLDGRKTMGGHEGHGEMTLRFATIDAAGGRTSETELDGRACDCCGTTMTRTGNGLLIAYRDRSPEEIRDISVVRQTASGWSTPVTVHADNWKIAGCPVNGPQLDARGNDVVVTWYTQGGGAQVNAAFSHDGGATFGTPVRLDTKAAAGRVDTLLLPNGDAVATWIEGQGNDAAIVARRISRDGTLSPLLTVTKTSSARASGFPRATLAGDGVYVVWTDVAPEKRVRMAKLIL